MHPVYKVLKFHKGIDLVTIPSNGPIYAFVPGEVIYGKEGVKGSGFGGYGIVVAIKDVNGYLHCYAHLSKASVKVGDRVQRNQEVGLQGSTGQSTGEHLHYEIRKGYSPLFGYTETEIGVVDPTKYLQDFYSKKEELPKVDMKDANAIIDKYLKPAWGAAKTPTEKKEIGRLADILREASGQPKQNG